MKNITLFLLFITAGSGAGYASAQQQSAAENRLMVGYYGRPGAASLGVLGQYTIDELAPKIKAKADEYAQISENTTVTPAFHLIYGLASSEPGRSKDYILPLSNAKVMEYINAANSNGFAVIIDSQLGKMTPIEAVKTMLQYLKYDNVHLAIDPEFEVSDLNVRPGKKIGHITGEEINQVQSAMTDYMKNNGIAGPKILIVHMFTAGMVKDKDLIKNYDNIKLVMNLDGHGSPQLKTNIYNGLYTETVSAKVAGGFKLFFHEDKPSMMTPKQVMGMEPVNKSRIKEPPRYINYQ